MVNCKSCGLLHSPMVRCEVAKRLLGKAADLKICVDPVVETVPDAEIEESVVFDRKAYQRKYMKEYMKVYRARKG